MSSYLVSEGRAYVVSLIIEDPDAPAYLGFGFGPDPALPSDQALSWELAPRANGPYTQVTTTTSGDTYQLVATPFTATSGMTLTNLGLFSSPDQPLIGYLTQQVSSPTQGYIGLTNIGDWSTDYPYNIQISTEVMTVTSGDNNYLYIDRAQNGSQALSSIAALTPVSQAGGLFAKVSFGGIPLSPGDVINFTIGVQFE